MLCYLLQPFPISYVALQIEAALKEWSTGVKVPTQFTDTVAHPRYVMICTGTWSVLTYYDARYIYFMAKLTNLEKKAPTYFKNFRTTLYEQVL